MTKNLSSQKPVDICVEGPDGIRVRCAIEQLADVMSELRRFAASVKHAQTGQSARPARKPANRSRRPIARDVGGSGLAKRSSERSAPVHQGPDRDFHRSV